MKFKSYWINDWPLLILLGMSALNAGFCMLGLESSNIRWAFLILSLGCLLFCRLDKILPVVFFMHPNSALYDDIGFTYLFNLCIVIGVVRLFLAGKKINKKLLILLIILFLWEVVRFQVPFNLINVFSMVSWTSSYLMLLLFVTNHRDLFSFEAVYKYFFCGFVSAVVIAGFLVVGRWGLFSIPLAYRFTGLLRDANYYSVDALLLVFSAGIYVKGHKAKQFLLSICIIICGVLSVSKMFLLTLLGGYGLLILLNIKRIKPKVLIAVICSSAVSTVMFYKLGWIQLMLDKYIYRTDTEKLFTGRDVLLFYYLEQYVENPFVFLFGASMRNYRIVLDSISNDLAKVAVVHNTYVDVFLSWGVIGAVVYVGFVISIYRVLKRKKIFCVSPSKDWIVMAVVFALCLCALSYLMVDAFAILLLYVLLVKVSEKQFKRL